MERVVRGRSFTLSKTFQSDGVAQTPTGTPTVVITRVSDGTTVTTSSVAGTGVGPYTVTVTAANNLLLDTLDVVWTATIGGQPNTYDDTVEVAGDVLFTIAEARALKPLDSTTTYTTAAIVDMRTTVEQALEEACGVAFVPRYTRETINGTGTRSLMLRWPKVTAIRSATLNSNALTVDQLALLTYGPGGVIDGYAWTAGIGNLTVGYEHGYTGPPAEIKRAGLLLTKIWLTSQARPIDDRAITFNAGADGGTYSLAVPGRNGSAFGHPDVDVAVQRYGMAVGIA